MKHYFMWRKQNHTKNGRMHFRVNENDYKHYNWLVRGTTRKQRQLKSGPLNFPTDNMLLLNIRKDSEALIAFQADQQCCNGQAFIHDYQPWVVH